MAFHVPDNEWVIGSAHAATTSRRRPFGLGRLADERLAQLVAAGRERAFAVLYDRYHQPLYRYCRSMLRNDQDAQDALQSTFAAALAALQESKRNAPFRPWLFRIAHNEAITVIRRRRDAGQEISDSMLGCARSASEEADDRARVAVLMGDLAQLPERQRAALLMRELSGLSHAEISVALATTDTAAKQAIFDARNALTEFAEGRALACEEVRRKISERDGRVLRSRRVRSHLRDCSDCAAFAAAISERRSDLRALVPPLPAATSAALLARLGGGSAPGYGGAGGVGAAGKLGTTALASKAAIGATVVVTAAAGLGALPLRSPSSTTRAHATPGRAAASPAVRAGDHRATVTRPAALSRPIARPLGAAVPRTRRRHARAPAPANHTPTTSQAGAAAPQGVAPSRPVASPTPAAHGKSALPHGESGLSHGKSSAAPGHNKVAGAQSAATAGSTAAGKTKPKLVPPGQGGSAGKSAGAPGHLKSASPAK
jgi:RNA polymerase sigma factor (sigma-70 family)